MIRPRNCAELMVRCLACLTETLAGLHFLAFAILMLTRVAHVMV